MTEHPASLFSIPGPSPTPTSHKLTIWPELKKVKRNNILLSPGSFNPPHHGHLATILYLYTHRLDFNIVSLFIYADPSSVISSKSPQKYIYNTLILPVELRNEMFAAVPGLREMMEDKWLYLLEANMEGHIAVLREMTDLISYDGFDGKLVGFLGGDKLSKDSEPHLPPGELHTWGPVDEFLIMNCRRPVDFYDPKEGRPRNLQGCTGWVRDVSEEKKVVVQRIKGVKKEREFEREREKEKEKRIGKLWTCKALTVNNKPIIRFRASEKSQSNGISSPRIRKVMCEEVGRELEDQVLSVGLLVEWLKSLREGREEVEGGEEVMMDG